MPHASWATPVFDPVIRVLKTQPQQGSKKMVNLARFERASSTFAESRSDSSELQVHDLAEGTGVEPASAMRGGFQDHCLTS